MRLARQLDPLPSRQKLLEEYRHLHPDQVRAQAHVGTVPSYLMGGFGSIRSAWKTEGALEELLKMKQEGKLRFIGVSGTLPNLSEQIDSGVFDVFQIPTLPYNASMSLPPQGLPLQAAAS